MTAVADRQDRKPSPVWLVAAAVTGTLSIVALLGAWTVYRDGVRPVGEGELFAQEALVALDLYGQGGGLSPDYLVRSIRNHLSVEAVGVIDATGVYQASSAPHLVGTPVNAFLGAAMEWGSLAAIAAPLGAPIYIDGLPEWDEGEVVYQVMQLVSEAEALVLSYDIAELLGRRARAQHIPALTVQLVVLGTLLAAAVVALLRSRAEASRRIVDAHRRSTELEEHNHQLDAAKREAERALALAEETNRIRSEFVLMINHELRTPLTSVVTGAEILADQYGQLHDDDQRSLLRDVVREGRRLQELIGQMLTVARLENRGLNYRLKPVPALRIFELVTARSGRIQVNSPNGELVHTDPEGLAQLLLSLSDNALTHGAQWVRLSLEHNLPFEPVVLVGKKPTEVTWFLVEDDGPGIDVEFLPRAFEKFEKKGFSSGTGLGLYLARMMAEAVEGCIAVTTGQTGTVMAVGVPVAAARVEQAVTS